MAKMNWTRVDTQQRHQRAVERDRQYTARDRNEDRLNQLYAEGRTVAVEAAVGFSEALSTYSGDDLFLCDLQRQARAYGPGWTPTSRQLRSGRQALAAAQPDYDLAAMQAAERNRLRRELALEHGAHDEAAQAAEAVQNYTGTNKLLVSMRQQAERFGLGWVPSPRQLQCLGWDNLRSELALTSVARGVGRP